ncbi:hypothetical protein TW86_19505 [Halomonas sp. S2151]|nr:hypothetical protein TW86_19505 [Halomonas sp. S2151]
MRAKNAAYGPYILIPFIVNPSKILIHLVIELLLASREFNHSLDNLGMINIQASPLGHNAARTRGFVMEAKPQ